MYKNGIGNSQKNNLYIVFALNENVGKKGCDTKFFLFCVIL